MYSLRRYEFDIEYVIWSHTTLFKYNYYFGIKVQELLHKFYNDNHINHMENCIGAHIRWGDRRLPGIDSNEWCAKNSIVDERGERSYNPNGTWIDGTRLTSGQWADIGCGFSLPYGAVTIQHIVNASLLLSGNNSTTIILVTDDKDKLNFEISKFHESGIARNLVRIVAFPPIDKILDRNTLHASLNWWAGIEALRTCGGGFMYHKGSAASRFIYHALCYHHQLNYMKCPDTIEFGS
jgi:hypothetical protein